MRHPLERPHGGRFHQRGHRSVVELGPGIDRHGGQLLAGRGSLVGIE